MFISLALTSLLLSPTEYRDVLVKESIRIAQSNQACTYYGYNKIYYNLSIISMIDDDFDRYEFVQALRKKCKGKLSKWEEK